MEREQGTDYLDDADKLETLSITPEQDSYRFGLGLRDLNISIGVGDLQGGELKVTVLNDEQEMIQATEQWEGDWLDSSEYDELILTLKALKVQSGLITIKVTDRLGNSKTEEIMISIIKIANFLENRSSERMNLDDANATCIDMGARLPNIQELRDTYQLVDNYIDLTGLDPYTWASTVSLSGSGYVAYIRGNGSEKWSYGSPTDAKLVHCVKLENVAPDITMDSSLTLIENSSGTLVFSIEDRNKDEVNVTVSTNPLHGNIVIGEDNVTYIAEIDYVGSDSFELAFDDGHGGIVRRVIGVHVNALETGTEVCGVLDSNTTWKKEFSPYTISCNLTVKDELNIEAGVEVLVQKDITIDVYGTIKVEGTALNPVVIKSEDSSEKWRGIHLKTNSQAQGFFDYVHISQATTGLSVECCQGLPSSQNAATINHSVFEYLDAALSGYAGANKIVVRNTVFRYNKYALSSADKVVYNSLFEYNEYGLYSTSRTSVYNSEFRHNGTALYGGRGALNGCSIHDNEIGVKASYSGFETKDNNITNNIIGIILGDYDGYTGEVTNNSIYGNREYNVRNSTSYDITIPNNYWGSTNIDEISNTIYDEKDDNSLGKVFVEPVKVMDSPIDDLDGDGITNTIDNCSIRYNPNQLDFDNDNRGNACDYDDDNDGLPDSFENQYSQLNSLDANDASQDNDEDGYSNLEEYEAGTKIDDKEDTPLQGTKVCGVLDGNMSWEQEKSPYTITCNLKVKDELNIEAGVEVLVQKDVFIDIYGTLKVEGTVLNPVVIKSEDSSEKWRGIHLKTNSQAQGFFDYVHISEATIGLSVECCQGLSSSQNAATINHSVFEYLDNAISGYAGANKIVIRNSIFRDNIYALNSADKVVYDSLFENNEYGLYSTSRTSVYNSEFKHNEVAIYGGRGELNGCSIHDNGIGVKASYSGFETIENNITINTVGMIVSDYDGYIAKIINNNIYGNSDFNMKNRSSYDVNASKNWWGTTDVNSIDESIYDEKDDSSLGRIVIEPMLTLPFSPRENNNTNTQHTVALKRTGWNLIAICQNMNASDINMSTIEEIQSQDGKTIYTGAFANYSNLDVLEAGYAYWVKGKEGVVFNVGIAISGLEKPLLRTGWNLMGSCEDRNRVDIGMLDFEEIQSQDGKTIYTGVSSQYSNLDKLLNGYGYWVKGDAGTVFISK